MATKTPAARRGAGTCALLLSLLPLLVSCIPSPPMSLTSFYGVPAMSWCGSNGTLVKLEVTASSTVEKQVPASSSSAPASASASASAFNLNTVDVATYTGSHELASGEALWLTSPPSGMTGPYVGVPDERISHLSVVLTFSEPGWTSYGSILLAQKGEDGDQPFTRWKPGEWAWAEGTVSTDRCGMSGSRFPPTTATPQK